MNDSTRKLGSMLQQKIDEDKTLIEQAASQSRQNIERTQKQLERDLQTLSSAAKSTTEGVTTALQTELNKLPPKLATSISQTTEQASQALKTQIEQDAKRLILTMRLPFLLLLGALFVLVLALWIVMPRGLWSETTTTETMNNGKAYTVITSPDWTLCTIGQNKYPCKPEK